MEMFLTIKLCTYAKTELFYKEQIIYIKMDLALNNLQRLICHKTQQQQQTTLLKEPELICLYTIKWFQVFLSNTNNSIHY